MELQGDVSREKVLVWAMQRRQDGGWELENEDDEEEEEEEEGDVDG